MVPSEAEGGGWGGGEREVAGDSQASDPRLASKRERERERERESVCVYVFFSVV